MPNKYPTMLFNIAKIALLFASGNLALAIPNPPASLESSITTYLMQQASPLGHVDKITLDTARLQHILPPCLNPSLFLPFGSQPIGRIMVGLRCEQPRTWNVFINATIIITGPVLVSKKTLSPGDKITEEDLGLRDMDLTQIQNNVLNDPKQAIGRITHQTITSGSLIKREAIRQAIVIQQGQRIVLKIQSNVLTVRSEGQALANAYAGQTIKIKTNSGMIISGVAQTDGSVEIPFTADTYQ